METQRLMRVVMFTLCLSAMSGLMFNFVRGHAGGIRPDDGSSQLGQFFIFLDLRRRNNPLWEAHGTDSTSKSDYDRTAPVRGRIARRPVLAGVLDGAGQQMSAGRRSAAIPATAMLIPIRYIAPERRGSAMATAFVGLSIGSAIGPIVSSLVASIADWRWLFCIPLILITIPLYRKYLKEEELQSSGQFDWLGGGLLAAVTFLLLGVTNGSWWRLFLGCWLWGLSYVFVRLPYRL